MSPLLASAGGVIVFLVVAFGFGLVKHLVEKAKEAANLPPESKRLSPTGRVSERHSSRERISEEERTRRFLEALGLPPDRPLQPPPIPGMQQRRERPIPPIINPTFSPKPRRQKALAQQRPAPVPAVPAPPTTSANVHFDELRVREVPQFHTRASEVSAIPFELATSRVGEVYIEKGNAQMTELRRLLRTPSSLRSAVLLREILGPPPGLPSCGERPSLALP